MKAKKAIIVVTSHSQLGNTGKTTGFYLSEVTHPTYELEKAGYEVVILSPKGGKAPMDGNSVDMSDPLNRDYMGRADFVEKLEQTKIASDVDPSEYQTIIFSGGHGTMWDFADDQPLIQLALKIYENNGVVSAICHGPAALLNIKLRSGNYLIKGKRVAGFTNAEEEAVGLTKVMPFLLEDQLKARGALYTKENIWKKHVVVDGRLVTGQNPASAQATGEAVVKVLEELAVKSK